MLDNPWHRQFHELQGAYESSGSPMSTGEELFISEGTSNSGSPELFMNEVYPKVKVRELEDDDEQGYDRLSLQAFESLYLHDSCPVEEDSPPTVIRVPVSDISSANMPMIPPSKEAEKIIKKKDTEETKGNTRLNSILKPRAVLSSPDNDGMVGCKNKTRTELQSGLKNHNSCQNRHVQCKVIPRPIVFGSPVSTRREPEETSRVKHTCPRTKRSVIADPRGNQHMQYPAV